MSKVRHVLAVYMRSKGGQVAGRHDGAALGEMQSGHGVFQLAQPSTWKTRQQVGPEPAD